MNLPIHQLLERPVYSDQLDPGWKILGPEYWLKKQYESKFYILFIKYVVFEFKHTLNHDIKQLEHTCQLIYLQSEGSIAVKPRR